ncbi:MAG TPA: hypothetical protein VGD17_09675 [Chitinophagaceae bacterium]
MSYNKLFILGNTADIGARVQMEKDLSAAAIAKGYTVVKGIDIFPPSLKDPKPPTTEQILDSLKATGCNALIVVNLKRKEDLKYTRGVNVKGTTPMLSGIIASSLGYRNTNAEEIKDVNKPGSFAYQDGFFITSDLVDASTQIVVHSNISDMIEYSKLNTLGKEYFTNLIKQLEKNKMLKK